MHHEIAVSNQLITNKQRWAGRVASGLAVTFLVWDSVIKLLAIGPVLESFERLGFPERMSRGIGLLELCCAALYVIPRTSFLGAILLTGFLGGAVALHLRLADPFFTHVMFPTYVGALIWGGLALREPRLRALLGAAT